MMPDDAGQPKVKIMTIHASKGLEFPIVFLAGGFTQAAGDRSGFATYHDDAGRVVFDLLGDRDAQERVTAERLSEQRRLLYVALTRPIFKLYVPKVKITTRNRAWAGPVGTILLPALEVACPDKLGPLIAEVVTPPLAVITPHRDETAPTPADAKSTFTIDGPLFPPIDGTLGKRRIAIRSFSSMARHHLAQLGDGAQLRRPAQIHGRRSRRGRASREDPLRGPVFGDMVHKVLETIDFDEVERLGVCR